MAHVRQDRCAVTSTSTGTGSFTLGSALTGYRSIQSVVSTSDTFDYVIEAIDSSGLPTGEWETGVGTYSGSNVMARSVIAASSNGGSAVNFSAGTKRVDITILSRNHDLSNVNSGGALPVAYGGTASTSASGARTALGVAIGTDVQAWHANLAALSGGAGVNVASAATVDLGATASLNVNITGSTTITSFGNAPSLPCVRFVRFASALTLTHNTTSLKLPGAANITTATDDRAIFFALDTSGNWACQSYTKFSGYPVADAGSWTVQVVSDTTLTLASTDNYKTFFLTNASDCTVTIPTAADGIRCQFVWLAGAGTPQFTPSGTTVNGASSVISGTSASGAAELAPVTGSSNTWYLWGALGDLAAGDMNFTATDRLLGRSTSGAGAGEEITCTAAGRALLDDASASDQRTTLSAAARSQTLSGISAFIGTVANQDYKIVVKAPHGGTITEVTTISTGGTCTLTTKINTTALGGTANSVSTSEQSQTHSSSNTFVAGDDIVLTAASNSSCVNMAVTIKYTRTLD